MVTTKPFADISKHSEFADESEVLFMIGSIFRLNSINHNDADKMWIIRMTLCSDDEHNLKQVLIHMRQQIGGGETNLQTLGKVLWKMGKLDLAEKYFNRLLKELSPNDPLLSSLYEDLGELASQAGNYDMSVQWHQKLLAIKIPLRASSVNIPLNAKWARNGITVAGENARWAQIGITVAGGNGKDNGQGNGLNQLNRPCGLYVDDDQTIYIADWGNHRIVEWKNGATSGQVVAGGTGWKFWATLLKNPCDVIVDKERDSLIISDNGNNRVVRWPRRNGTSGETIISNIDCIGLTMDENGSLYVVDYGKHEVRRYRIGETEGIVVAGGHGPGNRLDQLNSPQYVFVDRDHSVYVSDWGNNRVMKWMEDAKQGIVVAGGQEPGNSLTQLNRPRGVVVDQLGTVYVVDHESHRIMRWPKGAKQGSVIAGGNGYGGQSNQLSLPIGLSFDRQGNLYVADEYNHRVQKFTIEVPLRASSVDIHPNAKWAKNGLIVAGGNGEGNGLNQLNYSYGLYVDDDQTIYVADTWNHRIVEWKYGATSGQ
ncbi:unnamed protein product, partial [Rotaria sordida]